MSNTLSHLIQHHYKSAPEHPAIIMQYAGKEDKTISYRILVEDSYNYARAYAAAGILPGEVVLLILQHSDELIYSFWGAVLHGAIPAIMPFLTEKLSPERYRADLMSLISISRPVAIVTYPEFEEEIRAALTEGDSVRNVIITDRVEKFTELNFDELPGFNHSPEDIAVLQHSSGTTGLQKGVALSHQAILNQLDAYARAISLERDDVIISWLPLYHDMGLIATFLMPILKNITLVLSSPFDWVRAPYRLFQSISRYKGTLTWLPNFSYNFCVQKVRDRDLEGVDLSSWRISTNTSESVKWQSHQLFFGRFKKYGLKESTLQCSYGMAENVFAATQTNPLYSAPVTDEIDREAYIVERIARPPVDGKPVLKLMSVGKAIPNTRICILDEDGNQLADRVIGEIAVQSNCLLTEYYHRPDITEKAFKNEWYLSGDYGYMVNSEVFVAGRKKDMIIVGGKNIYPQDLEALAYEVNGIHPGRAVAFGIEDENSGTEEVVLVAEVNTEDAEERKKIAETLRVHVSKNSAVILRHTYIVSAKWILKTSSGKTARSANREKFLSEMNIA